MYNKNLSQNMRNPGKAYIKLTSDELNEFFSKGLPRIMKEKCQKSYTLTDFRRGILEVNSRSKNDDTIHIVDLMLYALGRIEDLEQTKNDFQYVIDELQKQNTKQAEEVEETTDNTETEDK